MKVRTAYCLYTLILAMACACGKGVEEHTPVIEDDGVTIFKGGFANTKISLGEKDGAFYKALWEDGDELTVSSGGAILGTAVLISGIGSNQGTFSFPGTIADGTAVELSYTSAGITAEQSKASTDKSFRTTATADATIYDGNAAFTLTHNISIIRVSVATNAFSGATLNSVTFSCDGKSLNDSDGDYVKVFLTDAPTLSSTAQEIIFSTKSADCSGSVIKLDFDFVRDGVRHTVSTGFIGKELAANKVNTFTINSLETFGSASPGIFSDNPFFHDDYSIRKELCGIGEPLTTTHLKAYNASGLYTNINGYADKSVELIAALNASTLRMWFEPLGTYSNWAWNTVKMTKEEDFSNFGSDIKTKTHKILTDLKNAGVEEITGLVGCFPRTPSTAAAAGESGYMHFVPEFGSAEYATFMQYYEWLFKALSTEYPEIDVWEVANETNYGGITYVGNTSLDYNTLARINVDLCYAAKKGVEAGNPTAKVITPGFAPASSYKLVTDAVVGTTEKTVYRKYGVETTADFLELMYGYIKTGGYPSWTMAKSMNPDDFFDGVAIHTYDLGSSSGSATSRHPASWYDSEPINSNDPDSTAFSTFHWLQAINTVYEVMQAGGDPEKKIWITEFGVTTHPKHLTKSISSPAGHPLAMRMKIGSDDYAWYYTSEDYERQHAYIAREYLKALNTLDFVRTCHFFRLHSPSADTSWSGGTTATMFGLFAEPDETLSRGMKPRPIAYAVQSLYKGSGNLEQFATWESLQ